MSKSGNYNLSEIEKRDDLIQELAEALKQCVGALEVIALSTGVGLKSDLSTIKALIAKTKV